MQRREFLKATTGAAAALALSGPASLLAESTKKRPNLLFITVDDMNWSMPGFMGNKLGLTPNLDRLASKSHRFVNCRTTAPICQPSREAMMTGRVPHRSGGLSFTPIYEGIPTIVTALEAAGYYTAAIHKTEHMQPPSCFPWNHEYVGKDRAVTDYSSGVREQIAAARAAGKPFFINCNINDPHRPFYGSQKAVEMDNDDEGPYAIPRPLTAKDVDQVPEILEPLPPIREEYAQYCNSNQRADRSIGGVLDELGKSPEAENTIIFFSADHGMPFPFSKATGYDYGSRTPALLKYPGMDAPRIFEQHTCNIDYMPTLLDLMGVQKPVGMDGVSWKPLLEGGSYDGPELRVVCVNSLHSKIRYPQRSIQDGRYSLLFMPWSDGNLEFHAESMIGFTWRAMLDAAKTDQKLAARCQQYLMGHPLAFYDLKTDPGQRQNLLDRPEHARRIKHFKDGLTEYMEKTTDPQLGNWTNYLAGKPMQVDQLPSVKLYRKNV
jgi:N-sulfoglucosamine sulfohydrolase